MWALGGGGQKALISEAINGVFLEFIISVCRYSRFQLSADNNWFRFISHCDWSRNHAPLCQPIRYKTKTDHDFVAHIFPCFRQFVWFYFEFSFAL